MMQPGNGLSSDGVRRVQRTGHCSQTHIICWHNSNCLWIWRLRLSWKCLLRRRQIMILSTDSTAVWKKHQMTWKRWWTTWSAYGWPGAFVYWVSPATSSRLLYWSELSAHIRQCSTSSGHCLSQTLYFCWLSSLFSRPSTPTSTSVYNISPRTTEDMCSTSSGRCLWPLK